MELNPVGAGSSPQQQWDLLEKLADVEALINSQLIDRVIKHDNKNLRSPAFSKVDG